MFRGINIRRTLLGGLVAGFVSNVSAITLNWFMRAEIQEVLERVSAPQPGGGIFFLHVATRLLMGVMLIFIYVAIRPRFGPGPITALLTACVVWLVSHFPCLVAIDVYGLFTFAQLAKIGVWGLFETIIATLAGAWIYNEDLQSANG